MVVVPAAAVTVEPAAELAALDVASTVTDADGAHGVTVSASPTEAASTQIGRAHV